VMHLEPRTYAALLAGALPPKEARALAEHLAGECEACERFLSEQPGADSLDGLADAAIAAALPPPSAGGNDLEFARIQRALRDGDGRPRRAALPAAVAASLLAAGVAGLLWHHARPPPASDSGWDGAKGAEVRAIPVRLRYLRLAPFLLLDQGRPLEKGLSGEPVDRSASLLFEVETGRAADVVLARVSPGGGVELLWRQRVPSGRSQVTTDGRPAAYPLAALSGPQRFVLLAADGALDEGRATRAAAALAPPDRIRPDAPALEGLSLDVVEVIVTDGFSRDASGR